eukprot:COSAG02_NODE_23668_length_711_cov_1.372549_1_plen_37_part_10
MARAESELTHHTDDLAAVDGKHRAGEVARDLTRAQDP